MTRLEAFELGRAPAGRERPQEPRATGLAGRALAFVRGHLKESISVTRLARELGVSPRTLQRELKTTLQCSPRDAILAVKMRAARRMLESGELRVSEVAYRVGFETPFHFSRRFKQHFGHPPSALIDRIRS